MIKYLVIFLILVALIKVDASRFSFVKEITIKDNSFPILSCIYKEPNQYYSVDKSKLYYYDLSNAFSNTTTLNEIWSISNTSIPSGGSTQFKLSKYNGTDFIGYLTTQESVIQIGPNLNNFEIKYFETTSPLTSIDSVYSTGGQNNWAYIGNPPSLNLISNGRQYQIKLITPPSGLACNFDQAGCYLSFNTGMSLYLLGQSWGSFVSSSTGQVTPRIGGVVNSRQNVAYYCADSLDDGPVLEAWGSFAQRSTIKLYTFGVWGTCKLMSFDEKQGQIFILTTNSLIGLDTKFRNAQIQSIDASGIISMEAVTQNDNDDQNNYLLMTKISATDSTAKLIITSYESPCLENCNGNGYCQYGKCICKSGNSKCGEEMEILSLFSSVISNDTISVVLSGYFHSPINNASFFVYLDTKNTIISDIISYDSSKIVFLIKKYIPNTSTIGVEINGLTVSISSKLLNPSLEIYNIYQLDQYIHINASHPFIEWYQYSVVLDNDQVEFNLNSTLMIIEPNVRTYSSSYVVSLTTNGIQKKYTVDMKPVILDQKPTIFQTTGDPLELTGLYFGLEPILLLDDKDLSIKYYDLNGQFISTKLPSGVYSNMTIYNGNLKTIQPIVFSPSANSSSSIFNCSFVFFISTFLLVLLI
ncbi:hypothetical protein CYY_007410 [Polysphondylium violaceum]|uniref:EGF-like domain-containing protein n=1 Tax=Polysphondylium violaceum TaxID=133409 RepID=A0A8J4PPS3_9MYCE|nr:hypothetical protein CYY_007410 [Polysphondylium violaceum]